MDIRTIPSAASRESSPAAAPAALHGLPASPVEGIPAAGPTAAPRPLDLRGMAPPVKLSEARLEDLTIDGICGVY